MRRILANPSDIDRIRARGAQRHGIARAARVVEHDDTRRSAQNLTHHVGVDRSCQLDVDRFGVPHRHRDPYTGRADRQVGLGKNLARLVDHLALFAVQSVALEAAYFGNDVQVDLMRVYRSWNVTPGHGGFGLGVKLVDRPPARARDGLIGVDNDALDRIDLVDGPQRDHHLRRRAIWAGDDPPMGARRLRIDLGDYQRHGRVHAPGIGLVDVERACLRNYWR